MRLPDYIKHAQYTYILDEGKADGHLHVILYSPTGTQLCESECRDAPLTEERFVPHLWGQMFRWFPAYAYSPSAPALKLYIHCNGSTQRCYDALLSGTWQEFEESRRFDRDLSEALSVHE